MRVLVILRLQWRRSELESLRRRSKLTSGPSPKLLLCQMKSRRRDFFPQGLLVFYRRSVSCSKDLDDSKLRVELMMAAKVQGDFDKAQSYAITDAERKEIETCRVRVQGLVGAKTTEQEVAAAKMQARIRGSQVREQKEKQKMEHAAILVQKSYRGHSERDNQEEQRRLTWLQCVQFSPSRPIASGVFPICWVFVYQVAP